MKIQEKCLPCTVNQALKVADMVGMTDKEELLRKVFSYLSQVDYKMTTTPELIGEIFAIIKEVTKNEDPYRETRDKYNTLFLDRLREFEREIDRSEVPFLAAVTYAIIGNIIDFNPIHEFLLSDVDSFFLKFKTQPLAINDSEKLRQELRKAQNVLYLGDNCGEICLDKILLKKMKEINPACGFYFATRGKAAVNDSIEADAYFVGMDEYATIISNGDGSLGTVLHRTNAEFRSVYDKADLIIAKGQANYESLSEEKKNIYFLLMTKCGVIASDIGVEEMKMICMKQHLAAEDAS